ncbi:MAG: DegT/DnrJ/EryC1/StrS aminotransferase family protein [Dehalobacter sp.]|nr:DegT/DnrJ/EryC1/StrS aminotransferase family protein [Dehalobacter sp.]
MLNIPLMKNNILKEDIDCLINFLQTSDSFTQGKQVESFEHEWSKWLGVKHSVFVNSGASANFMTMAALYFLYGSCEVIVPTLTWTSDIASVIHFGHKPIFVDCCLKNLAMDEEMIIEAITPETKAVFLTYVLGFNGLSENLLEELQKRDIMLIEDVCESHGAVFQSKKLGSWGLVSNFSFYYAHHMSTIEGGMICTNSDELYRTFRMSRSHGLLRECRDEKYQRSILDKYPDLNEEFIFALPAFNMRSTELNAVIGRNQLKRLDANNEKRRANFELFLSYLDREKFATQFDTLGSCNYAFVLILQEKNKNTFNKITAMLREKNVEFRRGTAGGGNITRQPYVRSAFSELYPEKYKNTDHIHFFGLYIGNYPDLEQEKIIQLCKLLNKV